MVLSDRSTRWLWHSILLFYFAVGVGAFIVSAYMENQIFFQITQQGFFSIVIVVTLELAKVTTIIVYRTISIPQANIKSSHFVEFLTIIFKIFLIGLSLICSLAFVAKYLDRPNIEKIRKVDAQQVKNDYQQSYQRILEENNLERATATDVIKESYQELNDRLKNIYEPQLQTLEQQLIQEMNNVVGGTFYGARYRELKRRQENMQNEYINELDTLKRQERKELNSKLSLIEVKLQERLVALNKKREYDLFDIKNNNYLSDERVQNQVIVSLLATLNNGILRPFKFTIDHIMFVSFFSLLISFLLELTIYLVFSYLVISGTLNLQKLFQDTRPGIISKDYIESLLLTESIKLAEIQDSIESILKLITKQSESFIKQELILLIGKGVAIELKSMQATKNHSPEKEEQLRIWANEIMERISLLE